MKKIWPRKLFSGQACFSPSVPTYIQGAWGKYGGRIARTQDEQRKATWFFCYGMNDPWLPDLLSQAIVVFHAVWISKTVEEGFPIPLANYVLDDSFEEANYEGPSYTGDTTLNQTAHSMEFLHQSRLFASFPTNETTLHESIDVLDLDLELPGSSSRKDDDIRRLSSPHVISPGNKSAIVSGLESGKKLRMLAPVFAPPPPRRKVTSTPRSSPLRGGSEKKPMMRDKKLARKHASQDVHSDRRVKRIYPPLKVFSSHSKFRMTRVDGKDRTSKAQPFKDLWRTLHRSKYSEELPAKIPVASFLGTEVDASQIKEEADALVTVFVPGEPYLGQEFRCVSIGALKLD